MCEYILGIDGGGTKTLGVMFTRDGREQTRHVERFANFSVDPSATKKHIEACIDALLLTLKPSESICHIQLGIAGLSSFSEHAQYVEALQERYQTSVDLVSDAVMAMYSIKRDAHQGVIMIISGTGSIIMANEAKETYIIGGVGHLLGEEGSGYHLSIQTLKKVIHEIEEEPPLSPLSQKISEHLNIRSRENLIRYVYHGNKSEIAKLSLFIAQCAKEGDEEAIQLFTDEGHHLARQTMRAFRKLKATRPPMIALRGNFLMAAPYVKTTLLNELKTQLGEFIVDDTEVEPVLGAYYLSKLKLAKR